MLRLALLGLFLLTTFTARAAEAPLDRAQTRIEFTGHATLHDFHGSAQDVHGSAEVDVADPNLVQGAVIEIGTKRMTTLQDARDRHMRDWLNVEAHPEIEFRLTKLRRTGDPTNPTRNLSNWFAVSGNFTLNGVTRPLAAVVMGKREGSRLIVDGKTTLDTTQFGLPIISQFFLTVDKHVDVTYHLVFDLPAQK